MLTRNPGADKFGRKFRIRVVALNPYFAVANIQMKNNIMHPLLAKPAHVEKQIAVMLPIKDNFAVILSGRSEDCRVIFKDFLRNGAVMF